MAHQVSEKRDIITSFQKILCKTMAERVRIYDGRIDPIFAGQIFHPALQDIPYSSTRRFVFHFPLK